MTTPVTLTIAQSKPHLIDSLRKTWRSTRQHYQAQAVRFFGILFGLVATKVFADIMAGKDPLDGLDTLADWKAYMLPLVVVAWRQFRPQLGAKQVDTADGVTIVPDQVGANSDVLPDPIEVDAAPEGAEEVEDDSALADTPLTVKAVTPAKKTAAKKAPAKKAAAKKK